MSAGGKTRVVVWALCVDKGAGNGRELLGEQVTARFCVQVEANALCRFSVVTDSEEEIGVVPDTLRCLYLCTLDFWSDVVRDAQGMYLFHQLLRVYICHLEGFGLCVEESDLCDRSLYVVESVLLYQVHDMSQCYLGGRCNL